MSGPPASLVPTITADWELDYYSRPIVDADGKKRWDLLICSTPTPLEGGGEAHPPFRWELICPAGSVNSIWLRQALEEALAAAAAAGFAPPRRLRCWRGSMRTMVQRAAEGLGLELVPSRRCYALVRWLQEREASVYPAEPGYLAGPLAPPPAPPRPLAVPLPEAARGESWDWATLPLEALAAAPGWEVGFAGLLPVPTNLDPQLPVPGIRLFSRQRALAIAGWLAGLEPVRLAISDRQLVLEAGLDDRWLLATLPAEEAEAAATALVAAREQGGGLQFIAVQSSESEPALSGFWLLQDLPDA
ncbi:MAG: Tab2 family RNA-binding protein [Prochlorococcaceae cyanobacterium]